MKKRITILCLLILAGLYLLPIALTFSSSFMGQKELNALYSGQSVHLRLIPEQVTLDGYFELIFANEKYLSMFWRSMAIAVCISLGSTLISLFVGFTLTKISLPRGQMLRFLYTFLMMMPFQVTLLPNYMMIRRLGLYNTVWALILPGIFAPMGVFLVSQFMRSMPDEILEASALETNSISITTIYIIVPMSSPVLTAQFLLSFAEAWNMVEQPLVLLEDEWNYPLSLALNNISGNQMLVVFSGAVLYLMPMIFLYKSFESLLIQGIGTTECEVKIK